MDAADEAESALLHLCPEDTSVTLPSEVASRCVADLALGTGYASSCVDGLASAARGGREEAYASAAAALRQFLLPHAPHGSIEDDTALMQLTKQLVRAVVIQQNM